MLDTTLAAYLPWRNLLHEVKPALYESVVSGRNLSAALHTYTPVTDTNYFGIANGDIFNPTVGAINLLGEIDRGGDIYNWTATPAPGSAIAASSAFPFIFTHAIMANDVLRLTTDAPGLVFGLRVWHVPVDGPLKPIVVKLANGDNTVYTCPAGKRASVVWSGQLSVAAFNCKNPGGAGNVTLLIYHVPSGGTPGAGNLISEDVVGVNTNGNTFRDPFPYFLPGDTLVINADAATAYATGFVYEFGPDEVTI